MGTKGVQYVRLWSWLTHKGQRHSWQQKDWGQCFHDMTEMERREVRCISLWRPEGIYRKKCMEWVYGLNDTNRKVLKYWHKKNHPGIYWVKTSLSNLICLIYVIIKCKYWKTSLLWFSHPCLTQNCRARWSCNLLRDKLSREGDPLPSCWRTLQVRLSECLKHKVSTSL